jgi:hypothetical protein
MARKSIPDPLHRRVELERNLDPSRAEGIAEAYLEAGRAQEAVAFLAKAGAGARLAELRGEAIRQGDLFLLREVAGAQGEAPSAAEWHAAADAAAAAGKERYADEARRQAARLES